MARAVESSCINHPAVEAVGRCKQCGRPFCSTCRVQGPTGNFCSEACRFKHEEFTKRAQKLDTMSRGGGFVVKIYWFLKKLAVFALAALLIAVVVHYLGVDVPIVSPFIRGITN